LVPFPDSFPNRQAGFLAVVLEDGAQERYVRVSPGTGFADDVFENKTTLDRFFGSRVAWNQHGGWKLSLRDGTEYTVQGPIM
jgi:hypothetical protein